MDLTKFKDIHKNKKAFLAACGPSLNDVDVSKLEDEIVFGVSLAFKKEGLNIKYHFIGDMNIARQFSVEISASNTETLFVSRGIYELGILNHPNMYYFEGGGDRIFHEDVSEKIYGGGTSTFVAMQFAYYMGIKKLFIVGLDHYEKVPRFKIIRAIEGRGKPLVSNIEKDIAHFVEDYYGENVRYFLPDTYKMQKSYYKAKLAFEKNGREIYNSSAKTALSSNILPRMKFEDAIKIKDR